MTTWGRRRGTAAVLLSFAFVPPTNAQESRAFPDDDVQAMLRYLVEDGETVGVVLGYLDGSGTRRVAAYGSGGPDTEPLSGRSLFEIGSISKVFTGTLLSEMVTRGEVALEDPVAIHLPAGVEVPTRSGKAITLEHLATHTSGLPRLPDDFPTWSPSGTDPFADYDLERLYAFLSRHELVRDPGEAFHYSNLGAGLLGHALPVYPFRPCFRSASSFRWGSLQPHSRPRALLRLGW